MKSTNFRYFIDILRLLPQTKDEYGSVNPPAYAVVYSNVRVSYEQEKPLKDPAEIVSNDVTGVNYVTFYTRSNFKTQDIRSKDRIIHKPYGAPAVYYDVVTTSDVDGSGRYIAINAKNVDSTGFYQS